MAIAEATVIIGFAKEAFTFAQQTASKWYKSSNEMELFKVRCNDLKRRAEYWNSLLNRYNMDDSEIRSMLKDASQLLDKECIKINALRSQLLLRRMWTTLVFPEELTNAMDNLCLAFEELPKRLNERATIAQQLEKETFSQRRRLPFSPDSKYVEFKTTTVAVRRALESQTTGPVVTLCAAPGQGKTSMAKHLALFYQNAVVVKPKPDVHEEVLLAESSTSNHGLRHVATNHELEISAPNGLQKSAFCHVLDMFNCCGLLDGFLHQEVPADANPSANAQREALLVQKLAAETQTFPDGVFFYHCGEGAKSNAILLELWKDLGYQLLHPMTEAGKRDTSQNDAKQESLKSESTLLKELNGRLEHQKILIVLDDVWESRFVENVLVQVAGVKFLITTRKFQIWGDPICKEIPIRSPTLEEEYDILRKYISDFPKDPTLQLQGAIDSFIDKSCQNPLILANMATSRKDVLGSSMKEWKSAGEYFEKLLKNDADVQVNAYLFGHNYPKPMRASTLMAIEPSQKKSGLFCC